MDHMTDPSDYDWVDDDALDLTETLERFNQLEHAIIVVPRSTLDFATSATTSANTRALVRTSRRTRVVDRRLSSGESQHRSR